MKWTFLIFSSLISMLPSNAQNYPHKMPAYSPSPENLSAREAFQDMKFGMFIHWGVYSVLGDGEWVMHQRKIPYDDYKRLADFFNPQQFNAKEWVQLAKAAGMKYITITSRHHDGFSMFKTQASDYNIVDATPFRQDPLKELAEECKKEGIRLHFYYSLLDWGRPDYGFEKPIVDGTPENTNWNGYIAFMKKQLTELLTNYPAEGIWFDGHWQRPTANWHYDEIYSLIHQLNPKALIGNNHHLAPIAGEDFQMFEKDLPGENTAGFNTHSTVSNSLPLETCETMNNSWGFNINDHKYKTVKQIIHYMVNAAGRNANFLLNVGPMPNGKIQPEFIDTLTAVGSWLKQYGESIYGTRGAAIAPQEWGVVTARGKTMYAHVLKNPKQSYLFLPGLNQKITRVILVADKRNLTFKQQAEGVFVYLNGVSPNDIDTVIQLQAQ